MFRVDNKIKSMKRCERSTVIITARGSCLLSSCICNLDCLIFEMPMLAFLLYRYDENFERGDKHRVK